MRSRVIGALMLVLLVAGLSLSAGAQMPVQHDFTLRYWGSPFSFGNPAPATFMYQQPGWGFSYRGNTPATPWSFSASIDQLYASGMYWETASLYNANVRYRVANIPTGQFSLLAGYGGVSLSEQTGGERGTGSGLRVGADFFTYLQGQRPTGWYATGEVTWGPSWVTSFPVFPGLARGNSSEYRFALGHEVSPGMAAQVGWRSFTWTIPTSPGCLDPGCQFRWSGWTLELVWRR